MARSRTGAPTLAVDFIEAHPRSAARALEEVAANDAAALIAAVPARIAAPALAHMAPWMAAAVISALEPEMAGDLLARIDHQQASSVLRQLDDARRDALLETLPADLARHFKATVRYPMNTVGAWITQRVPVFASEESAAAALRKIKRREGRAVPHIFIVDGKEKYVGLVALGDLLGAADSAILGGLADRGLEALSSRQSLGAALDHPDWDDHPLLPVVDRRGRLLGALSRTVLREALKKHRVAPIPDRPASLIGELFSAYLTTATALVRLTIDASRIDAEHRT